MTLSDYLDRKPLYYTEIDVKRMPRVYGTIAAHFALPKIIHMVGTNGKGSTGRYIAHALHVKGHNTGHYTSPHIRRFNERIWHNGRDVPEMELEVAHLWLQEHLASEDADALSYFEYTTLLAMRCFDGCDYVVLEAGLGGEFDATNVFEKVLSVFTPIDLDHQSFLGNTILEIAATKLRSMGPQVLLSEQPYEEVEDLAYEMAQERGASICNSGAMLDAHDFAMASQVALKESLPIYLQRNLLTAMAALKCLHVSYDTASFAGARLFGRLSPIASNITLDVGHNVLAAQAIADHYGSTRVVLVYNSYGDKDYHTILKTLRPVIKRVELIPVASVRIAEAEHLRGVLERLEIPYGDFEACRSDEEYLVFGSFSVAEAFLNRYGV